jgi:hypothetical protein
VNVAAGSSVTLMATVDRPLPANWSWRIDWELSVDNVQHFSCTAGSTDCKMTVTVPEAGPIAHTVITMPTGSTGPAMYVIGCTPGKPTNGQPCPS